MATTNLPKFAAELQASSQEDRTAILAREHPEYQANKASWNVLIDAFEGQGGFLDGSYLWPYPRESDTEFNKRQVMARYHNYVESLVDLYVRFIFTHGVNRTSQNEEFNTWLTDVDGAGTKIEDFLRALAAMSLVTGHAGALIDKTQEEAAGPTRAEERARPVASIFTAPHILDWRYDRKRLVAVKLSEDAAQAGIVATEADATTSKRYLIWARDGWARYDGMGTLLASDTPALDMVPLIVLRLKPRQMSQMLGRALISNANVVRALYNRASEEDEVIRAQAFSVLTVQVDQEGKVDEVRAQLGNTIGAAKALVVKGVVKYETPDQSVPGTIRDNMSFLVREMYRAAHVRYQRDSLSAESGESIRLQNTELNEMLQGFAKALAQAELAIARAWFAWQAATPAAAQADFERAQVTATYPEEFFLADLISDLEAWATGLNLDLGPTMTKRIKKKAVQRIDPDIPAEVLAQVEEEIEAMPARQPMTGLTGLDLGRVEEEETGAIQ